MNKNYSSLDNSTQKLISLQKYKPNPHMKTANAIYRNLSNKPSHFLELALFKQQIKNNLPKTLTYYEYSRKARLYRTIFFTLAMLFICLGAVIFYQNITFSHMVFGELRILIKNCISTITVCIGMVAAVIGCSICVIKEATSHIATKAKRKLARIYTKKRIEHGIRNFFLWPHANDKGVLLRLASVEIREKINDIKAETTELLREIRKSSGFDMANHELLFSQALGEMNEQIKQLHQNFKELKL